MRIYILTQEDAFYIPLILDYVLAERCDIVAVGIVPGELRSGNLQRYFRLMGPRDFALQVLNVARHRFLDLVSEVLPLPRSWSVAGAARRARVACEVVPKINATEFLERLRLLGVDLIVSIACPQIFKRDLLRLPARGCINLHGALLPRYQGMLPSFWVLARGERETGVTVHWMDEAIDHGDILLQRPVPIRDNDTVHSLVRRSKVEAGRYLLVEAIGLIERGEAPHVPMDMRLGSYVSFPDDAAVQEFRRRGRRFI
jgi:folate-dependent phosphoribosylglycinamide formyltransferase PurN